MRTWKEYLTEDSIKAKNLNDLLSKIEKMSDRKRKDTDFSSLPTFGGSTPNDTDGIWSWDKENFLIQDVNGKFVIINRKDY